MYNAASNTLPCPVCDRPFTIRGLSRHCDHAHPGTPNALLVDAYNNHMRMVSALGHLNAFYGSLDVMWTNLIRNDVPVNAAPAVMDAWNTVNAMYDLDEPIERDALMSWFGITNS